MSSCYIIQVEHEALPVTDAVTSDEEHLEMIVRQSSNEALYDSIIQHTAASASERSASINSAMSAEEEKVIRSRLESYKVPHLI